MIEAARDVFTTPGRPRSALPGLVADVAADPDLNARVNSRFAGLFAAVRTRLEEAVARGEVHAVRRRRPAHRDDRRDHDDAVAAAPRRGTRRRLGRSDDRHRGARRPQAIELPARSPICRRLRSDTARYRADSPRVSMLLRSGDGLLGGQRRVGDRGGCRRVDLLEPRHHRPRHLGDLCGQFDRPGQQSIVRNDFGHQADRSARAASTTSPVIDSRRAIAAPTSRGSRAVMPPPGRMPTRAWVSAKTGPLRGDQEVAPQRHLQSAGERRAVDRADDRLAHADDPLRCSCDLSKRVEVVDPQALRLL